MSDANQEHGIITEVSNASPKTLPESLLEDQSKSQTESQTQVSGDIFTHFPVAKAIEILPNHACATAAQYDHYYVVEKGVAVDKWHSVTGW